MMKMPLKEEKIKSKLLSLDLESGSRPTNFIKRNDFKVGGEAYVLGFFLMTLKGGDTLLSWCLCICSLLENISFTTSGLQKKLQFRHEAFAKWVLSRALQEELCKENKEYLKSTLFVYFNRAFLQDSTCVKIPSSLASFFPSSYSKTKENATARIQLLMDLLTGKNYEMTLGSFRDNDQKSSDMVLAHLQPKDLVIRDKGYWALKIFKQIIDLEAYVLSRLRYGVGMLDVETKAEINLSSLLKEAEQKGVTTLEQEVLLGKTEQLKIRLVAIKLSPEVAEARRRKAKQDRHSKSNHSQDYLYRLGWVIFVTNVPMDVWTPKQVAQAYRLRWRIEIIFKVWKSKFNFAKMFENKASMTPSRAVITFYLLLAWLTLFFCNLYNFFLIQVYNLKKQFVSILKFADFISIFMSEQAKADELLTNPHKFIPIVANLCCYDKRKRKNELELLFLYNTH